MNEVIYKTSISVAVLSVIIIVFLFAQANELASDSSYYSTISKQIVKDQSIVYETENINSGRPVLYPQGYFMMNAIGFMFLGENFNKIIIFLVSLTYIFIVWSIAIKSLGLNDRSKLLAFLLASSRFFFITNLLSRIWKKI
jgi:hypothetical protein